MSTTTVSVKSLPPEDLRKLNEWNRIFQFSSQRELVEYIIFLGKLANEMDVIKGRLDDVSSRNALYSIGKAFLEGEFRMSEAPEFFNGQDLKDCAIAWQEYFGVPSWAAVERHLIATGLMVWGLATGPISGERFASAIGFLARSLMQKQLGDNVEATVKEYKEWQRQQQRRSSINPRREVQKR